MKNTKAHLSLSSYSLLIGVALPALVGIIGTFIYLNDPAPITDKIHTTAEYEAKKADDAAPKFFRVMEEVQTGRRVLVATTEEGLKDLIDIPENSSKALQESDLKKDVMGVEYKPD